MQNESKKGQSTVEYTILLVIVLIVTALVVVLLFNSSRSQGFVASQVVTNYWANADIALHSWAHNGTHVLLSVQNAMPHDISIQSISLQSVEVDDTVRALSAGENVVVLASSTWDTSSLGSIYQFDVVFNYQDSLTGNTYLFYGQLPIEGEIVDQSLAIS